jgi:hypothetical protein
MPGDGDSVPAAVAARVARLEARRELEELEASWAEQRERLMDRDGNGRLREPGPRPWIGGGLAFLGAGAIAVLWGASVGVSFAVIGSALLLVGAPRAIKRRREYRTALTAYRLHRARLQGERVHFS